MIYDSAQIIVNQLNHKFTRQFGNTGEVVLGNIAQFDQEDALKDKVVVTVVNLEEEAALKNGDHHSLVNGQIQYQNRPIHLYSYLLFSATHSNYGTSLKFLEFVMEYFQGTNVFTAENITELKDVSFSEAELARIRIILELFSLSFEQINHLWGSLGGKQSPSVLYRARLLKVTRDEVLQTKPRLSETVIKSSLS